MKGTLWLLDRVFRTRIARQTREHLTALAQAQVRASRERASTLLQALAQEPEPHVVLGETEWREPLRVPLAHLVKAHAIVMGATGSGKSMAALNLIEAVLRYIIAAISRGLEWDFSFGLLDAKGELFELVLCLLSVLLEQLPPAHAERLHRLVDIIDLASPDPVTSYNIASPWPGSDLDYFVTSRVGTLQELFPSGEGFSSRGSSVVKHVLKLLALHGLPFRYFDLVLSSEALRQKLLARAKDEDLRYYFHQHFPNEAKATIAAVRARLASALLSSASLKLALSGRGAPDFRDVQDRGGIPLIRCGGTNIPRPTARIYQELFLSDIRQGTFARTTQRPFLWVCDEAQNFFRTRQLRENVADLLMTSRSFGSFFLFLTQNLSAALQEAEMLETLHTNIRWSLTMRTTPRDGAFLRAALPVSGRLQKPRTNPYAAPEFYSPSEERQVLLNGLAHLPDRVGWLWLKSRTGEAIQIKTKAMDIPAGEVFHERVDRIRNDPGIGNRVSRAAYLAEIQRRDTEWLHGEEPDLLNRLKKAYRGDSEALT